MTSRSIDEGSPWYRNFWPWFIVVLLGVSVVGSLVTVAIAYYHRDVDVRRSATPDTSTSPDADPRNPGR
jgi:hypothetical protein